MSIFLPVCAQEVEALRSFFNGIGISGASTDSPGAKPMSGVTIPSESGSVSATIVSLVSRP